MEKEKVKNLAFWIMIISVIALGVYMVNYIHSESYKCMASPLTYGASKLTSTNGATISCSCYFQGSTQTLFFNSTRIYLSSFNNPKL